MVDDAILDIRSSFPVQYHFGNQCETLLQCMNLRWVLLSFSLNWKTENVVFPSRCAFCWNPFKFADVLSEKYLAEAKIKSINYGKRWQPLPINFEKFVNWMKRKKRRKKREKKKKKLDRKRLIGFVSLSFITSSNPG